MRRLSMKSKRRKSEMTTDSESEENGVARATNSTGDAAATKESGDSEPAGNETTALAAQKKPVPKKRASRGRRGQKASSEEPVEETRHDAADQQPPGDEQENGNVKGTPNKRRRKEEKPTTSAQAKPDSEHEYEVEKIVGHRTIKGRRQFLVRWKGYGEDADTWEQEKDLNCSKLIEDFLADEAESEDNNVPEKVIRTEKVKTPKTDKKAKKTRNSIKKTDIDAQNTGDEDTKNEKDNQKEFEVEKIIEVHFKKNKTREFLIRWKGFTSADDTWEPEENLNCPDLITKFMQKVEKAKTAEMRELRTNPAHTKRYTLTTHESGRRLSRRNMDKQRATYHECDE